MELTDRDYGIMYEIIEGLDDINPNANVKIKLFNNGFNLYYIAAEAVGYKDSPAYRECMDVANKRLDNTEKSLKELFKEQTGKTLSFKLIQEDDSLEVISPAQKRFYLRVFRTYELT